MDTRRRKLTYKRQHGKNFKYLVIFVVIALVFWFFNSGPDESIEEPIPLVAGITSESSASPSPEPSSSGIPKNLKSLSEVVEKSLEGTSGTYAVYIKNLKTNESYSYNDNKTFQSGSLYKLWTMATVFNQIESENLKEDEKLSQGIAVLNRKFSISPENAEQTSGTITLTVKEALNQMITISHNYAALLLTEKVKLSTVSKWLEEKKFTNSKVGTDGSAPETTALDMALFMERLYRGELANSDSTTKMIELLKAQQLNNKLPLYLPPGTVIAHKTGELGWFSHDAGIVYTNKGDYVIVVMSESSSPKGAEERIAQLSKNVFEYFAKK